MDTYHKLQINPHIVGIKALALSCQCGVWFANIFFWTGPILLEDYHLVEKLANFDRERIPERVVHARGASAKGFFEVTHDVSHLTCADFLRAPGVQTPIIVRFSTVIHERGSPETLRDPRGFAIKFYTREVSSISILNFTCPIVSYIFNCRYCFFMVGLVASLYWYLRVWNIIILVLTCLNLWYFMLQHISIFFAFESLDYVRAYKSILCSNILPLRAPLKVKHGLNMEIIFCFKID